MPFLKTNRLLLYLSSWRYYLKHPLQLFFSVLGVALGVAIVVGIDMASQSARQGFYLSTQSITGKASHRIIGLNHVLPESIYTQLRNQLALRKIAPLIKQTVQINVHDHAYNKNKEQKAGKNKTLINVQLVGIDPFSEFEIRTWQQGIIESLPDDSLQRLLIEANTIVVEAGFLKQYHLQVGDQLQLEINKQSVQLAIIAAFNAPEIYQSQLQNWLIGDISTVQELLNYQGYISRIDLLIAADNKQLLEQIQLLLPEGVQLVTVAGHGKAIARLSQSFELNLTALSLLGLLVAMFLIYNTMMFSVVQRRDLLARMRVLGVTRKELFRLILFEAFFIAVLSTAAGIVLGIGLAHILLYFVTRTINDLYYVLQVSQLYWSHTILLKALLLGIGATLLSALIPALEAAYTRPVKALQRSDLETKINQWSRWLVMPGLLGFLVIYLLLKVPVKQQMDGMMIGFIAVFILIAAFICLLPFVSRYLLTLLAYIMKRLFLLPGKIAVNNISRSFSRSIVAIAALTVSVSAALGIGIMVDSFRFTVDDWLSGYLKADYFISSDDNSSSQVKPLAEAIDQQLLSDLSRLSGVDYISTDQEVNFYLNGQYHRLTVLDIPAKSFTAFHLKEGNAAFAQQAWFNEDAVIISEPYAYRYGLSVGDDIFLPVSKHVKKNSRQAFKIAGIYYHYGSEQGVITMNRTIYNKYWSDSRLNALGLYLSSELLEDKNSLALFEKQLQKLLSSRPLQFISKQNVQQKSLIIFDRTFKITNVLKLLVILVSFVGILSALMAIELERSREFAILRATGLTGKQLSTLVYIETLTMGIVAAVLAIPMGIALAYLLIEVVNYRSFGWSMQFILPWEEFIMAVGMAILSALTAAIYPARHLSKTRPALALRGD